MRWARREKGEGQGGPGVWGEEGRAHARSTRWHSTLLWLSDLEPCKYCTSGNNYASVGRGGVRGMSMGGEGKGEELMHT